MRQIFSLVVVAALTFTKVTSSYAQAPKDFTIEVIRSKAQNGLIKGDLGLNNANIGQTFENADKKIPAGEYKGILRYVSKKNFVAGPLGTIGTTGDFLLEVADVGKGTSARRTNILFHGGNKASQSEGCIMVGAVPKAGGVPNLPEDHPLAKMRLAFYGSDTPVSSPDVHIVIRIVDPAK